MVVVSDSRVKNVATFPTPSINEMEILISNDNKMTAKAVLICRPNSHPFQDRSLTLDQPIKVGRSVVRARATVSNAIFDCKVLSRNHALLWYENGKFYLQDTKSSNGTFVNNNKLSTESDNHEVSSGDIVQFGVDVVENNRKVTHGCIIATLKLYLPDGKEAKASPSITEVNRHGMVPLDELYKLNQIIQEASEREECLQTKLAALQLVVEQARYAADSSWAAYVGEERLLSRIATLETQLSQVTKNWSEDRCQQELIKLQDDNVAYQVAAKEALEKLHAERLEAIAFATDLKMKGISARQDADLAKEQVTRLQFELEEILHKLSETERKSDDDRIQFEMKLQDLQSQLEDKMEKLNSLDLKLDSNSLTNTNIIDQLESHCLIYTDDLKAKEEMLAENEEQSDLNKVNGDESQNHITLNVRPVTGDDSMVSMLGEIDDYSSDSTETFVTTKNDYISYETKNVKFKLPEEFNDKETENSLEETKLEESQKEDKEHYSSDNIDSKTLKYQYQSTQNELKRKIESLETLCSTNQQKMNDLDIQLSAEKQNNNIVITENDSLKEELLVLKEKLKESCNECRQLKDKVNVICSLCNGAIPEDNIGDNVVTKLEQNDLDSSTISNKSISYEELVNVEEELILLKEQFAQVSNEKLTMQNDMVILKEQYNMVCNRSHTKTFFYVAPLILIVLYLLISKMFS